jgi:hypothetical protein
MSSHKFTRFLGDGYALGIEDSLSLIGPRHCCRLACIFHERPRRFSGCEVVRPFDRRPQGIMATQKQIAAKLGVTQQAVSKLAKAGMPVTSIASAQKWVRSRAEESKTAPAPGTLSEGR